MNEQANALHAYKMAEIKLNSIFTNGKEKNLEALVDL